VSLKVKSLYQISSRSHILLEVHVSYTVEEHKYHTNCRLTFKSFFRYYCLPYRSDRGIFLYGESVGLVAKQ